METEIKSNARPHKNICDHPRENQQKGDDTGTRASHGMLSVTYNMPYAHI